jgi:hypothetical protein
VYRIVNLGQQQQTQGPNTGGPATPATYGCPFTPPPTTQQVAPGGQGTFEVSTDPTLNCMRDARGNAVCSDGQHYPPGCPHTPPDSAFTPGITPDVTTNGRIEGQIPSPRGGGSAPAAPAAAPGAAASTSSPSPVLMAGAGALGASLLAVGAYFLFVK